RPADAVRNVATDRISRSIELGCQRAVDDRHVGASGIVGRCERAAAQQRNADRVEVIRIGGSYARLPIAIVVPVASFAKGSAVESSAVNRRHRGETRASYAGNGGHGFANARERRFAYTGIG